MKQKEITYEWKSQPYGLDSLDHFREHFAAIFENTPCHMALPICSLFYSFFFCLSTNTITFARCYCCRLVISSCCKTINETWTFPFEMYERCNDFNSIWMNFRKIVGKWLRVCVCVCIPYRDFHVCLEISVLQSVSILYFFFPFSSLPSARFSFNAQVLNNIYYTNIKFKSENKLDFSFAEGVCGFEHFSRKHLCAIAIEQRCSANLMNCTR